MILAEALIKAIGERPRGTVCHDGYITQYPGLGEAVEDLGHSWDAPGLDVPGCVKVSAILGWCMDALYNYGLPDDIAAFPTHEVGESPEQDWAPF